MERKRVMRAREEVALRVDNWWMNDAR